MLGLAPAAHGGNRTGRVFTGDRSGDWLFGVAVPRGMANQPESVSRRRPGLTAAGSRRRSAVPRRPTSRPRPSATTACPTWSGAAAAAARAGDRLPGRVRLGRRAAAAAAAGPRFPGRGRSSATAPRRRRRALLLGCYHPCQQNTFTGKLTEPMIDDVMGRARELGGISDRAVKLRITPAAAALSGGAGRRARDPDITPL